MVGLEALIVLTGIGEIFLFARRYQHGRASGLDLWALLEEGLNVLVPGKVVRLILQELRILAAPCRWTFRRNRLAENEFAYHKRSMLQTIVPLVVVTSSVELLVVHRWHTRSFRGFGSSGRCWPWGSTQSSGC